MSNNKSTLSNLTINKIEEFHEECIGCELCTEFCAFHTHNKKNPKDHAEALSKGHHQLDVLNPSYDCTSCGYCQVKCPKGIDYKDIHVSIKKNIYSKHQQLPNPSAEKMVNFHQKTSFHKFFNHSTTGFTGAKHRKVFFPGCSLISFQPETVLATYEYLQQQNDNIGIMSYCCGKPTEAIGKLEDFTGKFKIVKDQIAEFNIEEVITACPNCHMVLKEQLPNIKITHISQALLKYGLPNNSIYKNGQSRNKQVTIHDPCPMRYETEIHTSVRLVLGALGFEIRERTHSMEHTLCCGSGAMLRVVSPAAAEKYTKVFLSEFSADEPVITYCQECVQTLTNNQKYAHHLLNIVFSPDYSLETPPKDVSFLKKWANRYTYKNKIARKKGLF